MSIVPDQVAQDEADLAPPWGMEAVIDPAGWALSAITDPHLIARFATDLCRLIGMKPYGPPQVVRFGLADPDTAGYTLVQLIETSSITAHFAEARRAAYLNVFSCRPFDPDPVAAFAAKTFGAERPHTTVLLRR